MTKGKQTCKILKEIRKQIAEQNDIELVISECTYQGDCDGTCPKCEAEVRYLERELGKRQRMGKAVMISGMALTSLLGVSACGRPATLMGVPAVDTLEQLDSLPVIDEPLMGDVAAPREDGDSNEL